MLITTCLLDFIAVYIDTCAHGAVNFIRYVVKPWKFFFLRSNNQYKKNYKISVINNNIIKTYKITKTKFFFSVDISTLQLCNRLKNKTKYSNFNEFIVIMY